MPTPANSVLNRELSDDARIAQLIYENESLKIEVDNLKEQIESTGVQRMQELKEENDSLRYALTQAREHLEERARQLQEAQQSNVRFSNIDDNLRQLLEQLQNQRNEVTEMALTSKEKDSRILELTSALENLRTKYNEEKDKAATTEKHLQESLAAVTEENQRLSAANGELQTLLEDTEKRLEDSKAELDSKTTWAHEREQELLALKAEVAEYSAKARKVHAANVEGETRKLHANVATMQMQLEQLQEKLKSAQAQNQQLDEKYQQAKQDQKNVKAAVQFDPYAPEVKAHVQLKVREAVEAVERRLSEQVDQNAALLARIALTQQESDAMVKKNGRGERNADFLRDRVDHMSKRQDAKSTMHRQVAELLSNDTLSREDVELLLQQMLDYQEEVEQDFGTRLLISNVESEEKEKVLRWHLKRLENENHSLLKQLQKAAFRKLQRHTDEVSTSPTTAQDPLTTAAAARSDARTPSRQQIPHLTQHPDSSSPAGGGGTTVFRDPSSPLPPSPPAHAAPYVGHTPSPSNTGVERSMMNDLWVNTPTQIEDIYAGNSHERSDPRSKTVRRTATSSPSKAGVTPTKAREANVRISVCCPACTYEQPLSNGKCEICETKLRAN